MALDDMHALLEDDEGQDWEAVDDDALYEEEEDAASPVARLQRLGLTPLQWFLLSFLTFLSVCLCSMSFLLLTGRLGL